MDILRIDDISDDTVQKSDPNPDGPTLGPDSKQAPVNVSSTAAVDAIEPQHQNLPAPNPVPQGSTQAPTQQRAQGKADEDDDDWEPRGKKSQPTSGGTKK